MYAESLKGHHGQTIEAKNKLVYCWPQWLLIVPDKFLSGRAGMRGPLSDQRSVMKRFFSVLSVGSVRALFFCVLRVLRGFNLDFLCALSALCG